MPLLAATPGNPVEHIAGLIPVGDTLFSGFNIFITVALIVVMPFITRMMMPKPSDVVSIDPKLLMEEADFQKQLPKNAPPSERLEESRILTLIIGALGIAYGDVLQRTWLQHHHQYRQPDVYDCGSAAT